MSNFRDSTSGQDSWLSVNSDHSLKVSVVGSSTSGKPGVSTSGTTHATPGTDSVLIPAATFLGVLNFQNKHATANIDLSFSGTAATTDFAVGPGAVLTLNFGPTNALHGISTAASAPWAAIGA